MESTQTNNETKQLGDEGRRVVLLITTPVGQSFQSIARAIGRQPPPSPHVDWSSFENSALPDLKSRLKFTTHYALCVIDCDLWDGNSLSLLDKFRSARFWDHPGDKTMSASSQSSRSNSSMKPANLNACVTWNDAHIIQTESGEEIGRTDKSDDEITQVYRELRRDWTYMPVFWNCHDLAIRLAHIILPPSMGVIRVLKSLMHSLRQAYHKEIDWSKTAGKTCMGGWGAAAVGGVTAVPPLLAAGVCVFVAGWSVGFFGGFVHNSKLRTRYAFMIKLEERFPQLKSLHR
ncbi:hypothetical protein BCR34DRAFT_35871 [Clohesyomyces aquaticus]|uniref:Uncharacterized protein n=1 Tax=Clohesyomyces aquaticus TaxID=1231657 RepID=A0A1Y1Z7H7_9PLEO|nr:hypothetical protein BCR34DRAFT_35871 [Clohesyomyces aquaticus]